MAVNLLTQGAIIKMCLTSQEFQLQPVLQVIDLKHLIQIQQNRSTERYQLVLSDGSYFQIGMLASQKNKLVHSGRLQKGSVIKINQFICNDVHNRKIIIVVELDVLLGKCDLIGALKANPSASTFESVRYGASNAAPSFPKPEPGVSVYRSAPLNGSYSEQNSSLPPHVGNAPRPANLDVLIEKEGQGDESLTVLMRIRDLAYNSILDGDQVAAMDTIFAEANAALHNGGGGG